MMNQLKTRGTDQAAHSGDYHSDALTCIAQSQIGGLFQAYIAEGFPLLYANPCYYQLHGYTQKEFEEKFQNYAQAVVVPEDIDGVTRQIEQAMLHRQELITLEYRVLRGDGKIAWLHVSGGLTETAEGILLSGMVINIDQRKSFEQQLLWSEKRFQIAMEQTQINVWEYDLQTRSIIPSEKNFPAFGHGVILNVPESQISGGIIHPDDIQKYTAIYTSLHLGQRNVSEVIRVRSADGNYRWEQINYTNLFDKDGNPVRAVAVAEDISSQKEAEQRFFQEEYLREMLSADTLLSVKVNLTQDKVLYVWSNQYRGEEMGKRHTYESLLEKVADHIANNTDRKKYLEQFSRESVNRIISLNQASIYGEYRCTELNGHIVWCAFRLTSMLDPVSQERIVVFYIRDINERKQTELALQERAERDALTGLYNRQTVESMIHQRILRQQKSNSQYTLFMVDMDDFKQTNDRYGHYAGDRLLQEVGRILREETDSRSIAGRIGGDEFLIFVDRILNKAQASSLAENLCDKLNIQYVVNGETLHTSASVGLVTVPSKEANFKEMFQQADSALYEAKFSGKATYVCFEGSKCRKHDNYILRDGCIARQYLGEHCMLDQLDDAIFIIDELTYDVLFMNSVAEKMFEITEYRDRKCYDLLQGFSQPCVFCREHLPGKNTFQTWENTNSRLHKRFMIRDKLVRWNGRRARLEVFTDLSKHESQLEAKIKAEQVMLECLSILLAGQTLEKAVQGVLENLGKFYQADRAYFAKTRDMQTVSISKLDWCAPEAAEVHDENFRIEQSNLVRWLNGLRSRRIAIFHSIEPMKELFPVKYAVLREKGVTSFAAVALLDEESMIGYIGIENPRRNLESTTLLKSLSYFMHNEVSKRHIRERQAFLETHDSLTGLLNWNYYTQTLSQIQPEALSSMGVLMVDVNHLYVMNQKYGSDYSDQLLRILARRLQENFEAMPAFRLSGDSFVVLCQDITYRIFLKRIDRFREQMEEDYPGSIAWGSSWADKDIQPGQLLNYAMKHLMISKKNDREKRTVDNRLNAIRLQRLQVALNDGRFQIYLQPKAKVDGGEIQGAEALVRYCDTDHGIVPPNKFIPQLEAEKNIQYVDFFVLREVCKLLCSWKQKKFPILPISLNFSRYTLMEENVVEKMNAIIREYDVDRSSLEIEITESAGDLEQRALTEVSQQIIDAGYRLSLDDFGAEYSNISTLSTLPLNGLKLDKSLIHDLYSNSRTRLLVENLICVCREIGIDSIAEGVEGQEQLDILKNLGCTYAQGYLYNKPLPVQDFEHKYFEVPIRTGQA